jgi:hypothetical protein
MVFVLKETKRKNYQDFVSTNELEKLRGQDLNLRPSGYEPDELPGCSTPRSCNKLNASCIFARKLFFPRML